jgi:serine/threonine-protein kinase
VLENESVNFFPTTRSLPMPAEPPADCQSRIDAIVLDFLKAEEAGRPFDRAAVLAANPDLADDLASFFAVGHRIAPVQRDGDTGVYTSKADTDPSKSASPLPQCAGRIQIHGRIDGGGMGDVLLGHDPEIDREVAVKVLLAKHRGDPQLVGRFITEAKINGRLQHPGIAPIYEMGKLDDGSPYFAMKLIQGHTLEEMLDELFNTSGRVPPPPVWHFLKMFEQICQTIAYAHSKGIIHRDLKPKNVMVGAFGEVQVMDWGLAKVKEGAPEAACGLAGEPSWLSDTPLPSMTQKGQILGTLAYMSPEQARGETDQIDERSDVFGLGAILCVILTGQPPHTGANYEAVLAQIQRGDLSGAFARLDSCGFDPDLIALAKSCLNPIRDQRPEDGQAVAKAMTAYIGSVEKKRQAAEIERAAAEAKAEEAKARANAERKARFRTVGIAVAALLLLVAIGGGAWWWTGQRSEATTAVESALAEAQRRFDGAWNGPAGEVAGFERAVVAAKDAVDVAHRRPTPRAFRQQAEDTLAKMQAELESAKRDARLLNAAMEVRNPQETAKFIRDQKTGFMVQIPQQDADAQFSSAFDDYGLDVKKHVVDEIVEQINARPPSFGSAVAAILDEWAAELQTKKDRGFDQKRLIEVADKLDKNENRRGIRILIRRGRLIGERSANEVSRVFLPYTILSNQVLGEDSNHLRVLSREYARQLVHSQDPTQDELSLLLLSRALLTAGDETEAEQLLRAGLRRYPGDVALLNRLGRMLEEQHPPRWQDAAECYAAARAVRPVLGVSLARALGRLGKGNDEISLLEELILRQPDNPALRSIFADILIDEYDQYARAEAELREALRLAPKSPDYLNRLGVSLLQQQQYQEGEAQLRAALELSPRGYVVHCNLGSALLSQKRFKEAEP